MLWRITALSAALLVIGCSGDGNGTSGDDDVGQARLAVTNVPTDVLCLRVSITSSRSSTRLLDVAPGQNSTYLLSGLATGVNTFDEDAFSQACGAVTATSSPSWVGDPVSASITSGVVANVNVVLRRNGKANVTTDFQDDPSGTCGAVGAACATATDCCAGTPCVAGICSGCPDPLTSCTIMGGSACVDLGSDSNNCGACGLVCPPGTACNAGVCMPTSCPASMTTCTVMGGSTCVNLSTDSSNCGACGHVCPAGTACNAGACGPTTCTAPLMTCTVMGATTCVNPSTDSNNCGACGVVCPAGAACNAGVCMPSGCPASMTTCTVMGVTTCVDLATSSNNCGLCGHVCPPGTTCNAGLCF